MPGLSQLFKLIRFLNSETTAGALAGAFALGLFLGLVPISTAQGLLGLLALLFLRVNISACLFSMGLFKLLSLALNPAFDALGRRLLEAEGLRGLWTFVSNSGLSAFMLHNSVALGATLVAALAGPSFFFLGRALILRYRDVVGPRLGQSRLALAVRGSTLYRLYRWGNA